MVLVSSVPITGLEEKCSKRGANISEKVNAGQTTGKLELFAAKGS
jgi:hypothetical protein